MPADAAARRPWHLMLISDPRFLVCARGFALAEQTDPRGQQPSRNQPAQTNIDYLPPNHSHHPVRNRSPQDGIAGHEKEKVQGRDEQEPAEPGQVLPDEFVMGATGGTQGLVMEDERNLDGAKGNDQDAHDQTLERKKIEHSGNIPEIRQQKRRAHDQRAHDDDQAGPFQDITEATHREPEKIALMEAQALDPGQADRDQVNLNINSEKVFEDESNGVDRGGDLQTSGHGNRRRQTPKRDRFQESGHDADQQDGVDREAPPSISLSQCANESAVEAAPVKDQQESGENRQGIGRGRVVENSRDAFQRRKRHFPPDIHEAGPRPDSGREGLAQVEIGRRLERGEGGELENRISGAEQDEGEPDSFETGEAAKAVPQSEPDRVEEHDHDIAPAKSQQRIDSRHARKHLVSPNESDPSGY